MPNPKSLRFNVLLGLSLLISCVGCHSYTVDVSASNQFSSFINRCFVTTKPLKVVKHEREREYTELCVGNSGPGLIQLGSIEAGSKVILRRVNREHVVYYGDLYRGIVEFEFQGKLITADAFTLFLTRGEFAPNPEWLSSCE